MFQNDAPNAKSAKLQGKHQGFCKGRTDSVQFDLSGASLDPEHREIALVHEILFRNKPCSMKKSWAISLEHGSGKPKCPRHMFPFAGERFYCRFEEYSSRKDESHFVQSIYVKKNL